MVHTRKLGKVMVAVIMALSFVSIGLSSAFAEDGDIAAGSSSLLTGGNGELSAQEDGDYTVDSWASLQDAINNVGNGMKITLNADIVAGPGDGALAVVRPDVSFTIDLAGHTINRNLQSMGETHKGHVLDVNKGTLTITDSSSGKTGKIIGGYDENGGGIIVGGEGHLVIHSGIITGNQGAATVSNCTISGNTANLGGGGIYNDNNLTLTSSVRKVIIHAAYASGTPPQPSKFTSRTP